MYIFPNKGNDLFKEFVLIHPSEVAAPVFWYGEGIWTTPNAPLKFSAPLSEKQSSVIIGLGTFNSVKQDSILLSTWSANVNVKHGSWFILADLNVTPAL